MAVMLEPQPACHPGGHVLGESFFYIDGLLVGYCEICEARCSVPWIQGGTAAARVRWLVSHLGPAEGPQFESVSRKLAVALRQLDLDEENIRDARELAREALSRSMGSS